ncbi:ATP-dependent helicase SGS1 [Elysia marginata]|uniref:ATP-dependent helicase SGS1 n=1 Tax=Elysia marginata TaxID=1093978 RepID=A0AAV4G6V8_9GAST|nr:ATP-dependent helicase SGS1 [Elysia marginata]
MSLKGDDVVVSTYSVVHDKKEPDHIQILPVMESPHEIEMKLISKDAIWKVLDSHKDVNLRSQPNTCESLNRLALYLALAQSSKESRQRYLASGRPIIFEKDSGLLANFMWKPSPLSMWQDVYGLHVKSVAMVTKDYHYCKVLPPYRAMEWVNVDSLRAFPNPL